MCWDLDGKKAEIVEKLWVWLSRYVKISSTTWHSGSIKFPLHGQKSGIVQIGISLHKKKGVGANLDIKIFSIVRDFWASNLISSIIGYTNSFFSKNECQDSSATNKIHFMENSSLLAMLPMQTLVNKMGQVVREKLVSQRNLLRLLVPSVSSGIRRKD